MLTAFRVTFELCHFDYFAGKPLQNLLLALRVLFLDTLGHFAPAGHLVPLGVALLVYITPLYVSRSFSYASISYNLDRGGQYDKRMLRKSCGTLRYKTHDRLWGYQGPGQDVSQDEAADKLV